MVAMDADVAEVEIAVELNDDRSPVVDQINGRQYCRLSWQRGNGPPFSSGVYLWLSHDDRVLYVGKATSNRTSHLYRRITAYKRATPGKTQLTSLRLNSEILDFVQQGGGIRLLCLVMPDLDPADISKAEESLIRRSRPPWNRQGNPDPRSVEDAMPVAELLGIDPKLPWPRNVSIPA